MRVNASRRDESVGIVSQCALHISIYHIHTTMILYRMLSILTELWARIMLSDLRVSPSLCLSVWLWHIFMYEEEIKI